MPDPVPFDLPFDEAVDFFRSKGFALSPAGWEQVWREANARAFTVARITAMDVLMDIREAVDDALAKGTSLGEFKAGLRPLLERKGWFARKGEKAVEAMPDGEMRKRIAPWRIENIYRTNLQAAYSVGRYKQMTEVAPRRPYWQYMAILDSRTRPNHAAMHGKVFDYRHPVWDKFWPPSGFGCRCYVKSLSERQVKARGLKVETRGVSVEPDRGWDYNVGKEGLDAWQPNWEKYPDSLLRSSIKKGLQSPVFEQFLAGEIHTDFPIAVLDAEYRELLGAKAKTIHLSADSLNKNKAHHPDLGVSDYQLAQQVIEQAETIIQDGDQTMVFLKLEGKIYHAVVKATASGKGLFLTSYRITSLEDVQRAKRRGKVIKDGI